MNKDDFKNILLNINENLNKIKIDNNAHIINNLSKENLIEYIKKNHEEYWFLTKEQQKDIDIAKVMCEKNTDYYYNLIKMMENIEDMKALTINVIKKNPIIYYQIPDEVKYDKDILVKVLSSSIGLLIYQREKKYITEEVFKLSCKQNPSLIEISDKINDKNFLYELKEEIFRLKNDCKNAYRNLKKFMREDELNGIVTQESILKVKRKL